MVYLISAKEIEFYYQRQKCATRCRFFYQTKKSSTRYGICYQTQNPLPEAEFFYQTLRTQKNFTLGGVLHPQAMNAQVTLPDVGIIYQTPQLHKVLTSRPVRPGCRLLHQMEVSTSRCTVFFLMESVGSDSKSSDTTEHQSRELDLGPDSAQESPEISVSKKLTKVDMAGLLKMSSSVGNGDRRESAAYYLTDVEMAAKCGDATYGQDADKPDESKILLFRQNLDRDGDAWYWWSCILGESEKKNYSDIEAAFLARYGAGKNRVKSRFNIQNELMCLSLKPGQPIADYVREAEILSERVPADMNDMLALAFIRGLAKQESGRLIYYDLRDTPEFTFPQP